jgi:hypothetical protein
MPLKPRHESSEGETYDRKSQKPYHDDPMSPLNKNKAAKRSMIA